MAPQCRRFSQTCSMNMSGKYISWFRGPIKRFFFPQTCSLNMSGKKFDTMWVPEGGYIYQTCSSKFEKIYPPKGKVLPPQSCRNVRSFSPNKEGGKFSNLEKPEILLPHFDELEQLHLRKFFTFPTFLKIPKCYSSVPVSVLICRANGDS